MRWAVLFAGCLGACEPSITDPCPGQRTCPDEVCCAEGFPYHCGTQCYTAPCGADQVTCINVDRTDGCYGGRWEGSFTGPATSGGIQFDVFEHQVNATMPATGSGMVDCDANTITWATGAPTSITFTATLMHTESRGDVIVTSSFTSPNGSGTWTAVRVE